MSKKLLKGLAVAAVVAVLAVGGAAVVHQGNKYQNKKTQAHQEQVNKEAAQAKQVEDLKALNARLNTQYTATRIECEKGLGLSAKLTALQKANTVAPTTCGPAVVQ